MSMLIKLIRDTKIKITKIYYVLPDRLSVIKRVNNQKLENAEYSKLETHVHCLSKWHARNENKRAASQTHKNKITMWCSQLSARFIHFKWKQHKAYLLLYRIIYDIQEIKANLVPINWGISDKNVMWPYWALK